MAFKKKTWKDRLVEFAGRRTLKRISGSADSQMVVDVSRNEGTVSQAGDAFSAANMNDLEQRIADEFSSINNNLGSKANGTFAVLTGTTHTTAGQQTSQNYPSGFNQNNCAVAGVMIKLGQNWYFGNYNLGYTYINAQVILSSQQVGIIPASGWTNCQYKIVLYKYA